MLSAKNKGFTLVELLVTLAISVIVIAVGFSLLQSGNSTFRSGSRQYNVQSEARYATDFIVNNLRNAKDISFTAPTDASAYSRIYLSGNKIQYMVAGGTSIAKTAAVILNSTDLGFTMKQVGQKYVLDTYVKATDGTRSYDVSSETKLNNIKSFTTLNTAMNTIYFLSAASANTVNSVASSITAITTPFANDTTLMIPIVPAGFTIVIASISPSTSVLNTSGTIVPPSAATTVSIIFTISKDGTSVNTQPIPVTIPAKVTWTASTVATSIQVFDPILTDTSIMPTLPARFTAVIKSSSPIGIIAPNGGITFPVAKTTVTLVFTVTNTANSSDTADTTGIVIDVPGTGVVPTYTITYNGNGSTSGAVPADSAQYAAGATATVLGNTGSLVKTGYVFVGWNTKADGTGAPYVQNNTFSVGSADVMLYAKWALAYTCKVTAGTKGSATPVMILPHAVGDSIDITATANTGYRFKNWTTSAGGTFGSTTSSSTTFTMPANAVTVTANFEVIPKYTLTINRNNSSWGNVTGAGSYAAGTSVAISAAAKANYHFVNWTTAAGGTFGSTTSSTTTFTMPANAVAIKANFAAN